MKLSLDNNRILAVLFTILTLSLALNVFLGWQVKALNSVLKQERPEFGIQVGTDLSSLPLFDLEGRSIKINFNTGTPTVVYVLSPACGWCRQNEPNMHVLAERKSAAFNFVGISPTVKDLQQYVSNGRAPFTIYVAGGPAGLPKGVDFQTTPQTLIVSPSGVVQKAWLGAYTGARKREIENYFGVDLPGIKTQ